MHKIALVYTGVFPLAASALPRLPAKLTKERTTYVAPSLTFGRISSNDIDFPLALARRELSQRIG